MKQFATLLLVLVAFASQAQTTCVDPLACNFTESGECIYVDENGDLCVVEGCNIEGACNYDPEADLNDGSCDFESCLGCTDETACNFDAEAVYLDNSCIYYIDCNGTCGGDWIQDECGNCFAPAPDFGEMTLTSCGAVGHLGPTQQACDLEYGNEGFVSCEEGIQTWVVPVSGVYRIDAFGASGTDAQGGYAGLGAWVGGEFDLEQGQELKFLVGQLPGASVGGHDGAGGGGTFVATIDNTPLLVAGGGGGATEFDNTDVSIAHGRVESDGGAGQGGQPGGTSGYGAPEGISGYSCAGQGAGFYTNAGVTPCGDINADEVAFAFVNGGQGGVGSCDRTPFGGFGGGGGTGCGGAGAGGGYSGGGGTWSNDGGYAGGGGSYNSGNNPNGQTGFNAGSGYVVISPGISAPECELGCTTLQACNYNEDATNDDGTCDYCFCGPGTEYSVEAGQCLVVEGCTDFNDDGCTGTQDLLHLLSNFGNCDE